jgi:sodium-dependent dicarboxylate transporter 2/3/5
MTQRREAAQTGVGPGPPEDPALLDAVETLSDAELRFDRARRSVGLLRAAHSPSCCCSRFQASDRGALFAAISAGPSCGGSAADPDPDHLLLSASQSWGVGSASEMFGAFGDPIIFLFLGSFILAQAMLETGLDRRLAYGVLSLRFVGSSSSRILLAFTAITVGLSGWLSNTATTAMLYPIGMGVLGVLSRLLAQAGGRAVDLSRLRYGTALMLTLAWASSIGGIATPIKPPNLIVLGQLHTLAGEDRLLPLDADGGADPP